MSWTDQRIDQLKALWEKGLTASQIADELGDFVDLYYTNYGKAALVIYAHWYDPGDDATASWVSEAR